ncbi:MAG: cytochrome c [Pirellulaceae bacterium]
MVAAENNNRGIESSARSRGRCPSAWAWLAVSFAALAGCTPAPEFRVNVVAEQKREQQSLEEGQHFTDAQKKDIGTFLTAVYGTPDVPRFPALSDDEDQETALIRQQSLAMASGPVASDRSGTPRGLYREHCVHCHGITGDGAGPTASFLNPYPRDFRLGKFKYKSTPLGVPPTDADLHKVLVEGLPGTAMPSFRRLPDDELQALVDYVKYLTLRGQTERTLYDVLVEDPHPLVDLIATEAQFAATEEAIAAAEEAGEEPPFEPYFGPRDAFEELVLPLTDAWFEAEDSAVDPGELPEEMDPAHPGHADFLAKGRELFFGVGNCYSCHGNTGLGDGQVTDFDDWTKDWMQELGITLEDTDKIEKWVAVGAMPPRNIIPRNLRAGVMRGGRSPGDIYLRLKNGIEGTPMPAAPNTLSDEELWALVAYVRQMPYEAISLPEHLAPVNQLPPR